MIYIFHGDHTAQSFSAYSEALTKFNSSQKISFTPKSFDSDSLSRFLDTPSLFAENKTITLENIFTLPKTSLDKLKKLIDSHSEFTYLLWQDKKIEAAKLKLFPQAQIQLFTLPEILFSTLNSIRPKNSAEFILKFQKLTASLPPELLLFWLKFTLRRQLSTYSKFEPQDLKAAYRQLVDLDYRSKSSLLFQPKETALASIILHLIDSKS